jgi:predicted RND superfamily exporter protein
MADHPIRDRIVDTIAEIPPWASRNAAIVLATVFVVTAVMGYGATQVTFEDDLVDLLPEDNPHTMAARNVSEEFPQNYYVTAINLHIDPDKWEEHNEKLPNRVSEEKPENITDEVYVRGMYEFNRYFLEEVESAKFNITLDSYVRLINYTNSASCAEPEQGLCASEPDPDAFKYMPGTDPEGERQYEQNWQTFYTASPQSAQAIASPDWNTTRSVYIFKPGPDQTTKDVGREIIDAWHKYPEWAEENAKWDVFDHDKGGPSARQPTIIDAHTSKITSEDVETLGPYVLVFIIGALYVAFRNGRSIGVAATALVTGAVWSFGAMGWGGIPLNTLNLAVIPLILGNGIDYMIHIINEYLEYKGEGLSDEEAFREAGGGAGVPLFVATVTTVAGLLVMAMSPSVLMAQVGLVAAFAMSSIFLLAVAFIPAALTVLGTEGLDKVFQPSSLMPRLAETVARHRAAAAVLVLALTGTGLFLAADVKVDSYGSPALNFPEGDWAREQYRKENKYFFGVEDPDKEFATNWLIFEGDMTDPETHGYLKSLEENVSAMEEVRSDSTISIRFVIQQWQSLKGGTTYAPIAIAQEEAQEGSTYPDSRQEIESTLDAVFDSPLSTYASLFINPPDYEISVMVYEIDQRPTFEATEDVWNSLWDTVDEVDEGYGKPDDVRVHTYGYTATSYLFVEEQLPWLNYMTIAGLLVVTGLVYFFTRDLRATATVGTLVTVTTVWWLGILPVVGIGLSITLLLPMVFIMSIGSDYAVHMTWNTERAGGDALHVWETTGKAVMFSAITDGGAFAIFSLMRYKMMENAMLATSLAIVTIFLATILIIPMFYRDAIVGSKAPEEEPTPTRESPPDEAVRAKRS